MSDKSGSDAPSFEASLAELETLVREMESGDLPLNVALEKFERGIKLSRMSQQALQEAEQKVKILLEQNGQANLEDFVSNED